MDDSINSMIAGMTLDEIRESYMLVDLWEDAGDVTREEADAWRLRLPAWQRFHELRTESHVEH
jgi:hypothetical protein